MLFTIGLKVVIKVSDVRHDCYLRRSRAMNKVAGSPKTVPLIEFSLTSHSVDATCATCGVKLSRLILVSQYVFCTNTRRPSVQNRTGGFTLSSAFRPARNQAAEVRRWSPPMPILEVLISVTMPTLILTSIDEEYRRNTKGAGRA
jgi:hypothetical protein